MSPLRPSPPQLSSRAQQELNGRLLEAATSGSLSALESLVALGADPAAFDGQALSNAAHGHPQCVRFLLPLCDPRSQDSQALRQAVIFGDAESVALLAPASDAPRFAGPLLLSAIHRGNPDILRALLPHLDASINDFDALRKAAGSCRGPAGSQCVQALLESAPPPAELLQTLSRHARERSLPCAALLLAAAEAAELSAASDPSPRSPRSGSL